MNVLFLTSSMAGGGAERIAALLCNAWAARGHEVTLMPTYSERGECFFRLDGRVKLDYLADRVDGDRSRARRLWALHRAIRDLGPDLVVSFLAHVNIAALIATRGTGVPVIVSERTYPPLLVPPLGRANEMLRRMTYGLAHAVVVQSTDAADWIRRKCRGARPVVIPNPLVFPTPSSGNEISPRDVCREGRRLILALGRMDGAKRFDILINAFSRIASSHPDWELAILGDGPQRRSLEELARRSGLDESIHLPGFAGNVGDWYRRGEIHVMPTAYEGFPNVLVEAMAHGLPTVSFDIMTGPREITDNGRIGVLLPDDSHVDRLSEALDGLVRNEGRRQELSRLATEVRERYSPDLVLGKWAALMDRAVAGQAVFAE